MKLFLKMAFSLSVTALPGSYLSAQVVTGSITGTVRDTTGAVVPGVSVVAENEQTAQRRQSVTDPTGVYAVAQLPVGIYSVTASLPGFKTSTVRAVRVGVSETVTVELTLEVGEISDQVTVTAPTVVLQQENATLEQTIDSTMATELPLSGRNFVTLARLTPGAVAGGPQGGMVGRLDLGVNLSGQRQWSTTFLMDGVDTTTNRVHAPSVSPSVDEIQEIKVARHNFSAEYGQNAGIIQVVTKSGTNVFHGSLYEFHRNDNLDARQFFDREKPEFLWNQFGGTLGGPIVRNRTFFFLSYEGLRESRGQTAIATVPDPVQLKGDFSQIPKSIIDPLSRKPFPGNMIPDTRMSKVSKNFMRFIPGPNLPVESGNLVVAPTDKKDSDQFSVRVDHALSERDQLQARYQWTDLALDNKSFAPFFGGVSLRHGQNANVQWTHTFGHTSVNTVKLGYNRGILIQSSERAGENISARLGLKGIQSDFLPNIGIVGFSGMGAGGNPEAGERNNRFQISDTWTLTRGHHVLSFGFDVRHNQFQSFVSQRINGFFRYDGRFSGEPLADFLLGLPSVAEGSVGRPLGNLRSPWWAAFIQHDWKVNPNLTLNLGIRWDFQAPWSEIDDKEAIFDPSFPGGRLITNRDPADFKVTFAPNLADRVVVGGMRRGGVDPDWNNFGPRVGLAYSPRRRMVIRAGYGISYVTPDGAEQNNKIRNPPFFAINDFRGTAARPVHQDELFPIGTTVSGILNLNRLDARNRTPYVQQWNLSIQSHLSAGFFFESSYAGSLGLKHSQFVNINQAFAVLGRTAVQPRRPFPLWGDVLEVNNRSRSTYHALQVRLNKKASKGLRFMSSYTYSKSLDISSRNPPQVQDARNLDAEKGRSVFDVGHIFSILSNYALPFGRGQNFGANTPGIIGHLISGWQTSGIVRLQTGFPVTVSGPASLLNVGGFTQLRPNRLAHGKLDVRTPEKWFDTAAFKLPPNGLPGNSGRNILDGPGFAQVDLAVIRNFPLNVLGEESKVQFRAEFFNLFNRVNFNDPVSNIRSRTFGRILGAREAREIQFGLKLMF